MSQPPLPGSPPPPLPPPTTRRGPGMGQGAALGLLVGVLGPVAIGAVSLALTATGSSTANEFAWLLVLFLFAVPVVLLFAGAVLMVPEGTRGWGVAALLASGIWLVLSAGVCTVVLFGSLATYDNQGMVHLW